MNREQRIKDKRDAWIEEQKPSDAWERQCKEKMWDSWEYEVRMSERQGIIKILQKHKALTDCIFCGRPQYNFDDSCDGEGYHQTISEYVIELISKNNLNKDVELLHQEEVRDNQPTT